MHYEALSRALAYVSCLTSLSLFASSMAIAAVNIARIGPPDACMFAACAIHSAEAATTRHRSEHLEIVAAALPANP